MREFNSNFYEAMDELDDILDEEESSSALFTLAPPNLIAVPSILQEDEEADNTVATKKDTAV